MAKYINIHLLVVTDFVPSTTLAMAEDVHASKSGTLIAADATLICLSAIAVALRLLSRRLSRSGLWYDDYAIMFAMVLAWMLPVCNFIG